MLKGHALLYLSAVAKKKKKTVITVGERRKIGKKMKTIKIDDSFISLDFFVKFWSV